MPNKGEVWKIITSDAFTSISATFRTHPPTHVKSPESFGETFFIFTIYVFILTRERY